MLYRFFKKVENIDINYKFFFLSILIFQILTCWLINPDFDFNLGGDAKIYVGMLENLHNNGVYEYYGNHSGRMPGFLPFYLPLRYFFSQDITLVILVYIQLVLYSFSVVFCCRNISILLKWKRFSSLIFLILLGFTNYITHWATVMYTDALAATFVLIGLGFLFNYEVKNKTSAIFWSGFFFCWVVFLRPYFIIIFFVVLLYICIKRANFRLKIIIAFVSTLIITETIWVARNYYHQNQIILLQSTLYAGGQPKESTLNMRRLISSFGGDAIHWNPGSAGMWFETDEYITKNEFTRPNDNIFPQHIFNENFTIDSLKRIRQFFWSTKMDEDTLSEFKFNESAISFIENYKKTNPFQYYFLSPIKLIKGFQFHPFTYYFELDRSFGYIPKLLIKLAVYAINSFIFIIGSICTLIGISAVFKSFDMTLALIITIPLFLVLLFPLYFSIIEYRFQVLALPSYVISICFIINHLTSYRETENCD
jgi:hypothetical protein